MTKENPHRERRTKSVTEEKVSLQDFFSQALLNKLPRNLDAHVSREGGDYTFSATPFFPQDMHMLLIALTDKPSYNVWQEEAIWKGRGWDQDRGQFSEAFSDTSYLMYLHEIGSRLKTRDEAWEHMVMDRNLSKRLIKESQSDDKDYLSSDLATGISETMRRHPELWPKKPQRRIPKVSNTVATSRFNQLGAFRDRDKVFGEESERFTDPEAVIEKRIMGFYNAIPLESVQGRKAYLLNTREGEHVNPMGEGLYQITSIRQQHVPRLSISDNGLPGFRIYSAHRGIIVPSFSWQVKRTGRSFVERAASNISPLSLEERHSANVAIIHEIDSSHASSLLGILLAAYLTPSMRKEIKDESARRGKNDEKFDTSDCIDFILERKDDLLDGEFVKGLEEISK